MLVMGNRRGRVSLAVVGVLALVAAGAALAWACTPQAYIYVAPSSAGPGEKVTVTGRGFVSGPVQIHWNRADGPVIGSATGPNFSTTATVPTAPAGVYYIHAVAHGTSGVVGDAARAFQLAGAPRTSQDTRSPGSTHRPKAGARARQPAHAHSPAQGPQTGLTSSGARASGPAVHSATVRGPAAGGASSRAVGAAKSSPARHVTRHTPGSRAAGVPSELSATADLAGALHTKHGLLTPGLTSSAASHGIELRRGDGSTRTRPPHALRRLPRDRAAPAPGFGEALTWSRLAGAPSQERPGRQGQGAGKRDERDDPQDVEEGPRVGVRVVLASLDARPSRSRRPG
jgi:hypothetical protein